MSRGARRPLAGTAAGLIAFSVLGLGLRWLALEATAPVRLVGDERYYVTVASHLAAGGGHRAGPHEQAFRPPGFPALLALVAPDARDAAVLGSERFLRPFLRMQLAISTLLVLVTGLAGLALFGSRQALAAAFAVAVSPTLIGYSHMLFSETLFAVLLTAGLAIVVGWRTRAGAALAGLVFGLAALTREVGLLLAAASAAWLVLQAPPAERRRALARGAVLLGLALAVIAPWTLRNARLFDRLVLVSNLGWYTTAAGNLLDRPDWWRPPDVRREQFKVAYRQIRDEAERADFARATALRAIAEEQPAWLAKKLIRNGSLVWGPDSFVAYKLRLGAYGDVPLGRARLVVAISGAFYLALVVSAIFGLAGSRRDARALLGLLLLGTVTALHVAAIANTRHRMPIEPLLSVYAAAFWVGPRACWAATGRVGRAGAGVALAFLLLVATPYTALHYHAAAVFAGQTLAGSARAVEAD